MALRQTGLSPVRLRGLVRELVGSHEREIHSRTPTRGFVADGADDPRPVAKLHRHLKFWIQPCPQLLHLRAVRGAHPECGVELEHDARELVRLRDGRQARVERVPQVGARFFRQTRVGDVRFAVILRPEQRARASGERRDVDGGGAERPERLEQEREAGGDAFDPPLDDFSARNRVARGVHLDRAEVPRVHFQPILRAATGRGVHAQVLVRGAPAARALHKPAGQVERRAGRHGAVRETPLARSALSWWA